MQVHALRRVLVMGKIPDGMCRHYTDIREHIRCSRPKVWMQVLVKTGVKY